MKPRALPLLALLALPGCGDDTTGPGAAEVPELVSVSAGLAHTCAIDVNDEAWCWGANDAGQLGNGETGGSTPVPVRVAGGGTRFRELAAGFDHTCGLTKQDLVLCWGNNDGGALGTGNLVSSSVPVTPPVTTVFARITAGNGFTCALSGDGLAFCWGRNDRGQAGVGDRTERTLEPSPVTGGRRYTRISAGGGHACGVEVGGTVSCWGANDRAQIGVIARTDQPAPVRIQGTARLYRSVSAGAAHTCALTSAGEAVCWGSNEGGEVGFGRVGGLPGPIAVAGDLRFADVRAARDTWSCGRLQSGELACWGSVAGPVFGVPGDARFPAPVELDLGAWSSVTLGSGHACGVRVDEPGVRCWGLGESGQLGTGERTTLERPTLVGGS